jgi:uncharacterized protein
MARGRTFEPRRLDLAAFAEAEATLDGDSALTDFPRLAASLLPVADAARPAVTWQASGQRRKVAGGAPEVRLHLLADTVVTLECQRCLQPMTEPLAVDRHFRFVASEDEAARLDEESDDDVLALSHAFDLLALLEDELILALPLVPRHEVCPEPLALADEGEAAQEEAAANPFAALAALKRPPS